MKDKGLLDYTKKSASQSAPPEPIRGSEGAPIIGPTNVPREAENPTRLAPLETDHGTLPNLKFSFADVHNRLQPGGWARQITGREMQIAQALNCVNMRLKAGAIRELHWHKSDEWVFVIKGGVRITAWMKKAALSWTMWSKGTSGTSLAASRIRSRDWPVKGPSSCWSSTKVYQAVTRH